MFGIGMPEMLLILAIALIVIGPSKLPDLAKSIGRALGEFKKATNEIKKSIEVDDSFQDVKKAFNEVNADIKDSVRLDPTESPPPKKMNPAFDTVDSSSQKTSPAADADSAMDSLKNAFSDMKTFEENTLSDENTPPDSPERDPESTAERAIDEEKDKT